MLQPIGSTTQTWVVTFRYRISAVLPQMSFLRENSGGVLKKSLKVHNCFSGALPMSVVCEGSPTQPSIADLLEWLSDLERIHNELYPKKFN